MRIDYQWNGALARRQAGHRRRRVAPGAGQALRRPGEIAVYVDGAKTPLMTAVDKTFGSGRVGFGSFDNIGRLRDLKVTGTRSND